MGKHKKNSKESRKRRSSSSSSSDSENDKKVNPKTEESCDKDTFSFICAQTTLSHSSRHKQINKKEEEEERIMKIYKSRELNPSLRDDEKVSNQKNDDIKVIRIDSSNRDWLKKSFFRCMESAKDSKVSILGELMKRYTMADCEVLIREFGDKSMLRSRVSYEPQLAPVERPTQQRTMGEERFVTDEDINKTSAKLLKAEMSNNSNKARKLSANLAKLREAKARGLKIRVSGVASADKKSHSEQEELSDDNEWSGGRHDKKARKRKFQTHDAHGNRIAHTIEDTQNKSLAELVREERLDSRKRRVEAVKNNNCPDCLPRIPNYQVVCRAGNILLRVPPYEPMAEGHCLLSPLEHLPAITRLPEDAADELNVLKKQLGKMFATEGKVAIFMEMGKRASEIRYHTRVECVPVEEESLSEVRMYFRKSLMEAGSEWDANRKLVSLKKGSNGALGNVPANFAYFCVEFGVPDDGLLRVFDQPDAIPDYFGRQILADILDKTAAVWRKPKELTFGELAIKVTQLEKLWAPFDLWSQTSNQLSEEEDHIMKTNQG
ncbi:hypothetical protein Ciccas_003627 [Cichlidogyrus casuarinus]|uniref:CWF19-like protein 2 n=1 Tax=Cichlidogyrus casuarinus TaxID=1844966 RepID=A0ABD2QEL6_9PLAT